jgi:hypothetical protein
MLDVSDAAKEQLHKSLSATDEKDKCYRLIPVDGKSLKLSLAKPAPDDATVEHEGMTVLALPKILQSFVRNKSLDVDSSGNLRFS